MKRRQKAMKGRKETETNIAKYCTKEVTDTIPKVHDLNFQEFITVIELERKSSGTDSLIGYKEAMMIDRFTSQSTCDFSSDWTSETGKRWTTLLICLATLSVSPLLQRKPGFSTQPVTL